MEKYCKRLIEVDLPIKRISAHARREKSIRHGHISTLHIWWARRPLAACRAVICASLWPDPADDLCPAIFQKVAREQMTMWAKNNLRLLSNESISRFVAISKDKQRLEDLFELRAAILDFIADFSNWDNSTVSEYLETSRLLTQVAHEALGGQLGSRPLVVDPFAGGGAIPLEAMRVGADAFASDLNPVSILLNKVLLEIIPEYGQKLSQDVRRLGQEIKKICADKLAKVYPPDPDGSNPISYLWARIIRCEGPGCGATIPLIKSLWLAKGGNRSVALQYTKTHPGEKINFRIVHSPNENDVELGTLRRGSCTCPICGYTTPSDRVRFQFKGRKGGADDALLLAVVCDKSGTRYYREPTDADYTALEYAKKMSRKLDNITVLDKNIAAIPDEPLPYLRSIFNINLLDVNEWGELFTTRQALALDTLRRTTLDVVKDFSKTDKEYSKAISTLLAFAIDRQADYSTSICTWVQSGEFIGHNFAQGQSLPIKWDFAETAPFSTGSGNWDGAIGWICRVIDNISEAELEVGYAEQSSAAEQGLPDDVASAVFSDPPYYDAVPYADLSDFFYVWLKRTIGELYPGLFAENLTPKEEEVVQLAERNKAYAYKTKENFEVLMCKSLAECRRVVAPAGIGIFVFAHKDTSAWESMLQAVLEGGWIVTASWPIDTEMATRLRARNSAALASSIHLVCRPRENPDGSLRTDIIGDWRDVLTELSERINKWMIKLTSEGVVGADAIFACLGPSLEIYSRFSSVEKSNGEKVPLKEYLVEVWAAIARAALTMIFEGADAFGFEEDARLTAMWLWTLRTELVKDGKFEDSGEEEAKSLHGYSLEYDAARKIAQGLGAHLEGLSHLVEIKGDNATLLTAGARTRYLFGKDASYVPKGRKKKLVKQMKLNFEEKIKELVEESGEWEDGLSAKAGSTVLDQLHQCMILFGAGRREALRRFLVDDAIGHNPLFWHLAQALSALYPLGTDEKRWVDGLLARKKGLGF